MLYSGENALAASLLIDQEKKVALCCNLSGETSKNMVYTIGEDDRYHSKIPYLDTTNKKRFRDKFSRRDNKCTIYFQVCPKFGSNPGR